MQSSLDVDEVHSRSPDEHDAAGHGSWLALRPRTIGQVALGLIAFQAGLRLLMGLGAYFTQDDFVFYTLGGTQRFDLAYLFQDRGNHLMPAGQAIVWPLAQYLPLEHGPAVLATVALQVLASLAVLGLLREMFGRRTGILAPLAFYLFGALTLPAFIWWAAALNAVGLQLAMALALTCHLRWMRTRRFRAAAGTCASVLLGLAFFEKAVLLLPLLLGITWVVERQGGPLRDLGRLLRRHWLLWLVLVVEIGAWVALYLHQVSTQYAARPTPGVAADLVLDSVGKGVVPALFGGPWHWESSSAFLGFAPAPPTVLLLGSWVALLVLLTATLVFRRGVGRMWLVAIGYVAADLALLVWGRAGAFGSDIGLEYRYYADSALVFALLIGFSFMPGVGEVDPWRREASSLRAWLTHRGDPVRAAAWFALILWCVGATWSSVSLGQAWRSSEARIYVENAKHSLAELPADTLLLDEPVPGSVLLGWFAPYNGTAYVFAPLHHKPAFVDSVTSLLTISPDGRVVPGVVDGVRSRVGPNTGCGWAVTSGLTTIPLDKSVYEWGWTVKVAYLAGADTIARFTLGEESIDVPLAKGLHDVYFALPSAGSAIEVTQDTPGVGVCIDRIDVGTRSPAPSEAALSPSGQ